MKIKHTPRKRGFTLVELLTVIAIIGILAAILIPTVGSVMDNARKSAASSNLRQIGSAYNIYTTGGSRPKTVNVADIDAYAALLAKEADLNDPKIWLLGDDDAVAGDGGVFPVVIAVPGANSAADWVTDTDFARIPKSFAVANNLSARASSTVPVAWTRGLLATGFWDAAPNSVYGDEGGHIVFKDGHVEFFDNVAEDSGLLVDPVTKTATVNIEDAIGSAEVFESTAQ